MKLILVIISSLLMAVCSGGADEADYSGSTPRFVVEGLPFVVKCRVSELSRVKWHRDGSPVPLADPAAGFSVRTVRRGVFLFSNLTVARAGHEHSGKYKCTTFVDNHHEMTVIGADLIQTNADDTKGLLVMTTKTLVLNCSTSSEVPSDAVTWYKSVDGGPRAAVEGDSNVVVEGGLLTIKKPTEADAGNYTCRFSTAATPDKLVEETIHVITNVSVSMPSNSINKQEDDEVTILCEPFGRPRPTVSWTKDGKDVFLAVDNASRLTLSPDDEGNADARLKLTGLRRPEDAGDYCCHAENIANAAQGCTIVRVKDKYAALWPFIGIVAEVILLTAIIYIYEKKKSKPDMDDSDTDNGNDSRPEPKGDVRQRK